LPASVFVVVHRSPNAPDILPELLSERGRLPARHPLHEERVVNGTIYVAPPDNQLVVREGSIQVVRGPKENGHRPAVDALFRSAAAAYGSRVIGVVLSGYRDCGTAGMMSVKARGGVAVAQAPEAASVPEMPRSVIEKVAVDHIVHPRELASLLVRLVAEPAGPSMQPPAIVQQLEGAEPGAASDVVCPICQGVLTEAHLAGFEHFRCHVGHAFSLASLLREQSESLERALWASVRALEESAALSRRLGGSEKSELRRRFREQARTQAEHAELIRQILLRGAWLSPRDAPAA
jgi:two-component system chemotaxis response regulator CheB